jgi:hypothetical protein
MYPPPLNYPHIIRYDLVGVDIKFPLFDPGAGDASSLLTVIVIVFGVSVVDVAAATLRRCACLDAGLSECLFVQLVKVRNELSCRRISCAGGRRVNNLCASEQCLQPPK